MDPTKELAKMVVGNLIRRELDPEGFIDVDKCCKTIVAVFELAEQDEEELFVLFLEIEELDVGEPLDSKTERKVIDEMSQLVVAYMTDSNYFGDDD